MVDIDDLVSHKIKKEEMFKKFFSFSTTRPKLFEVVLLSSNSLSETVEIYMFFLQSRFFKTISSNLFFSCSLEKGKGFHHFSKATLWY